MRAWLLLFIPAVMFSSCAEQKERKPTYLLDEEKMVSVMVDLHLVETAHNLKVMENDTNNARYEQFMATVFVSNEVRKGQFDSSLFYYSTRTEEMNVIYDKVLERLSELESQVRSEQHP